MSGDNVALYLFDGSGSWGSGAEAAAWFREWIAVTDRDSDAFTIDAITETLAAAIHELPSDLTDCDFGWTFSFVVALVGHESVQIGASGSFAAVALRSNGIERLISPVRLVDELVARGTISAEEAETHRYRRIICSPFFGIDDEPRLTLAQVTDCRPDNRIVIGDAALPRFLETQKSQRLIVNAADLRNAIEEYGGSNTSTAVLEFPINPG